MKHYISIFLALLIMVPSASAFARTPNDSFFSDQWYLPHIGAISAWNESTGSPDVLVAILDTGIDLDHEDLRGQIFVNRGEVANDGIDNDGNGYIDDVSGWDFYDDDRDANPIVGANDEFGVHHGTVVAGVIGATGNNALGVTGVNWDVKMLPIRVLDSTGDGDVGDIVEGIDYALSMGADVINLSFVGSSNTRGLDQ
ncbi:MAG TPA: S8 family serine peptidase, partial [Patescibacteria group bacterium]|nr:S8 family serine peptidase [Patescibacteria group bacterium]